MNYSDRNSEQQQHHRHLSLPHSSKQCGECGSSGSSDNKPAVKDSELEQLKRRIIDRELTIVQLEAKMAEKNGAAQPGTMISAAIRANTDHWQDSYHRLSEAHRRLQRVNQGLEDKLLRLADRSHTEKTALTERTSALTTALTTAATAIHRLKGDKERLQHDLMIAIQLLQCNSSQYGRHKIDTLPIDLQQKVRSRMDNENRGGSPAPKAPEMKVIKVPIPTFPPTAMVYSLNKGAAEDAPDEEEVQEAEDMVSAAIMAAVLEERQREQKHCPTCTCSSSGKGSVPGSGGVAGERGRDAGGGQNGGGAGEGSGSMSGRGGNYVNGKMRSLKGCPYDADVNTNKWSTERASTDSDTEDLIASLVSLRLECETSLCDDKSERSSKQSLVVSPANVREHFNSDDVKGFSISHCICGRPYSSGANVIDVGTQTVPSYIGESGKVHSTCIYCKGLKSKGKHRDQMHSLRDSSFSSLKGSDGDSVSSSSEVSCYATDSNKKSGVSPDRLSSSCSWEWPPESTANTQSNLGIRRGDSGSPSTPSSFTTSASCDSELSSITSPQMSPSKTLIIPTVGTCYSSSPKISLAASQQSVANKTSPSPVNACNQTNNVELLSKKVPGDTQKMPQSHSKPPHKRERLTSESSQHRLAGNIERERLTSVGGFSRSHHTKVNMPRRSLVSEIQASQCLEVSADLLARLTATAANTSFDSFVDEGICDESTKQINSSSSSINFAKHQKSFSNEDDLMSNTFFLHKYSNTVGHCGEQSCMGDAIGTPSIHRPVSRNWHQDGVVASTATASATVTLL